MGPAQWDETLLAFYRTLIGLRRTSAALRQGGYQLLHTDADTIVFLRDTDAEQIVVVGYRGTAERPPEALPVRHGGIADGTAFTEGFTGQTAVVQNGTLPLPAMQQGPTIWQSVSGKSAAQ